MLCVVKEAWQKKLIMYDSIYMTFIQEGVKLADGYLGIREWETGTDREGVQNGVWEISIPWPGWLHGYIHM